MTQPLNKERQALVEANYSLIFTILAALGFSVDDVEDWYGIAAIALCEAARDYPEDTDESFEQYAEAYIRARLTQELLSKSSQRQADQDVLSIDDPCVQSELIDPGDITQDVALKEAIGKAMIPLGKQDKYIVSLMLCGEELSTIQRRVGVPSDHIESVWRAFAEAVKAEITA